MVRVNARGIAARQAKVPFGSSAVAVGVQRAPDRAGRIAPAFILHLDDRVAAHGGAKPHPALSLVPDVFTHPGQGVSPRQHLPMLVQAGTRAVANATVGDQVRLRAEHTPALHTCRRRGALKFQPLVLLKVAVGAEQFKPLRVGRYFRRGDVPVLRPHRLLTGVSVVELKGAAGSAVATPLTDATKRRIQGVQSVCSHPLIVGNCRPHHQLESEAPH